MNSKSQKTPIFNSDKELANFLLNNVADSLKQSIRAVVKIMIKEEMDNLRQEVNEKLSFNGYYSRNMISPLGKIENIPIARFREKGMTDLPLDSLKIFEQEKERFINMAIDMHRLGVSDRKVDKICQEHFGIKFSKNRVSAIHRELAETESFQINQLPLSDDFVYFYADGLWANAKSFGLKNSNKIVLLCILGVKADGTRQIIAFLVADSESYETWHELILNVKERGLKGANLKLTIVDDNGGLIKALKHLFPQVPRQVCVAHKERNVISKAKHKNKKAIAEDLKKIYCQKTKDEAIRQMQAVAKKWYLIEPQSIESLRFDFESTLTYLNYPESDWHKIRTTNLLEREFREVRRRIKVFDNSFNDRPSANRYANSIFTYLNDNYPAHLHTKS